MYICTNANMFYEFVFSFYGLLLFFHAFPVGLDYELFHKSSYSIFLLASFVSFCFCFLYLHFSIFLCFYFSIFLCFYFSIFLCFYFYFLSVFSFVSFNSMFFCWFGFRVLLSFLISIRLIFVIMYMFSAFFSFYIYVQLFSISSFFLCSPWSISLSLFHPSLFCWVKWRWWRWKYIFKRTQSSECSITVLQQKVTLHLDTKHNSEFNFKLSKFRAASILQSVLSVSMSTAKLPMAKIST
jgi:hypothetical protein